MLQEAQEGWGSPAWLSSVKVPVGHDLITKYIFSFSFKCLIKKEYKEEFYFLAQAQSKIQRNLNINM